MHTCTYTFAHTRTHVQVLVHTQPYVQRPRPIIRMRIIQPPKKIPHKSATQCSDTQNPHKRRLSISFLNLYLRAMPSHVTLAGCLPALMVNVPERSPVSSSSSSSSCRASSSEGPIRNAQKSVP